MVLLGAAVGLGVCGPAFADQSDPFVSPPAPDSLTALHLYTTDNALGAQSDATGVGQPTDPPGSPDPVAASSFPQLEQAAQLRDNAETAAQQAAANAIGPSQSSTKYMGQSPAQAIATEDRTFPAWLVAPLTFGRVTAAGQRLVRRLGMFRAEVVGAHGRRGMVMSSLPLIGRTPAGNSAPIDSNLKRSGAGFAPVSTATPVSLPASAAGEARFPAQGFGISLPNAGAQPGVLSHGRLMFANIGGAAKNTDAVYAARPTGFDLSFLLRAKDSPEDQSMKFSLPAGARLVLNGSASAGQQAATIVSGSGKALALVVAPSVIDAVGRPVPSSYTLQGASTLVMHVAHREKQFVYPILADPLVTAYPAALYLAGWTPIYDAGWKPYFNAFGNNSFTYVLGPTSCPSFCANAWTEWGIPATPGAYIYELNLTGVSHNPDKSNNSMEYGTLFGPAAGYFPHGSWRDSTGQSGPASGFAGRYQKSYESNVTSDYCIAGTTTGVSGGCPIPAHGVVTPGDQAIASGLELGGATGTTAFNAGVYGATLYQSDDITPTLSGAPSHSGYTPGTWSNGFTDNVTATGSVTTGLGMNSLAIGTDPNPSSATSPPGQLAQAQAACSATSCPQSQTSTLSYNSSQLPEGISTVNAQAQNAGGNLSSTDPSSQPQASWQVKIDRTPPQITVSGGAYDARTAPTAQGLQPLSVSASDQSSSTATSGVVSIQTSVDGAVVTGAPAASQSCSTGACSLSAAGQINFDSLSPGAHTIEVRATDAAGNVGETDWVVVVGASSSVGHTIDGCWTGTPQPSQPYPLVTDLGSTFDSLSLSNVSYLCGPSPSDVAAAGTDAVPATVPYVDLNFGNCQTGSSDGGTCADPLEIQFWPQCVRNELAYSVPTGANNTDEPMANTDVDLNQLSTGLFSSVQQALTQEVPFLPQSISQFIASRLSALPAASYDGGTRLELYTGTTTIVIFSDDPSVANLAASALATRLATNGLSLAAGGLASNALTGGC